MDGKECVGLLDGGAQISSVGESLAKELGMEAWPLDLLNSGEIQVVNHNNTLTNIVGWYPVSYTVPCVGAFKDQTYPTLITSDGFQKKPSVVTIGTNILDDMVERVTESEMHDADSVWNQAYCMQRIALRADIKKQLDNLKTEVRSVNSVTIPPHSYKSIKCSAKTAVLSHKANVVITPSPFANPHLRGEHSYQEIKGGKQTTASMIVSNHSDKALKIKKNQAVGIMEAGIQIPLPVQEEEPLTKADVPLNKEERQALLLTKLDLTELEGESPEFIKKTRDVLQANHDIFSLSGTDLGCTQKITHSIKLDDQTPFKERYRRINPVQLEEVKAELKNMLECGAITKSFSPWCNAVVLVRKKDGTMRFCIDFRKLNERTIKDAHSLPRIDEALDSLAGAKYFSCLDLKSGFWQVELDEASKEYTAFTLGPLGFYQCERMPFGLCNAPATFQRLMEACLEDLNLIWCLIYLDDVIVFSKTLDEHLERLEAVFTRMRDAGLKLKPSKCSLFKNKLRYLGHMVGSEGIGPEPEKIEVLQKWPPPKTVTGVRSFIGFVQQYRRFIKDYSQVAKPLRKLISGELSDKKTVNIEHLWDESCQKAFESLISICSQAPVLAYADFKKPFRLVTDASGLGLGAALYQLQEDGKEKPLAFASRALVPAECNYPPHKLEFLALKWAITDRFKDYLYKANF